MYVYIYYIYKYLLLFLYIILYYIQIIIKYHFEVTHIYHFNNLIIIITKQNKPILCLYNLLLYLFYLYKNRIRLLS